MRVTITGGTGFVGPAVVQAMLDGGHDVVVLEHRARCPVPDHPRLARVSGVDVARPETLRGKLDGADAVAHLVAIRRGTPADFERMHAGATRHVVEEAKRAGVRRFLYMSANGVDDGTTPYFRTKREAERIVKASGLEWTIFRPSYIADSAEGGFDHEFAQIVDKMPVLPNFNGGRFEIQPIARSDVADAFANALDRPVAIGKTYILVGRERFTWTQYLTKLAALRGRKRAIVYAPGWAVIGMAGALGKLFPASPDELRMLMEGSVGDPEPATRDLGLRLVPWETAVAGLARRAGDERARGPMRRTRPS